MNPLGSALLRHMGHADFCPWHRDQLATACTCGASTDGEVMAEGFEAVPPAPPASKAHGIVKPGWYCSREAGHTGPCAAWPVDHYAMPGWDYRPREPLPARQSKADSFMESLTNIAVGLAVSQVANLVVIPLVMGVPISAGQNAALALLYTAISLVRQYALRRTFNGRSVWQAIKGAWA